MRIVTRAQNGNQDALDTAEGRPAAVRAPKEMSGKNRPLLFGVTATPLDRQCAAALFLATP
jgi:hypothetical protein